MELPVVGVEDSWEVGSCNCSNSDCSSVAICWKAVWPPVDKDEAAVGDDDEDEDGSIPRSNGDPDAPVKGEVPVSCCNNWVWYPETLPSMVVSQNVGPAVGRTLPSTHATPLPKVNSLKNIDSFLDAANSAGQSLPWRRYGRKILPHSAKPPVTFLRLRPQGERNTS